MTTATKTTQMGISDPFISLMFMPKIPVTSDNGMKIKAS